MTLARVFGVAMLLTLAACGSPEPPEEHVWQDQVETLDRANALEEQMQKDAEEKRRQIEAQGG